MEKKEEEMIELLKRMIREEKTGLYRPSELIRSINAITLKELTDIVDEALERRTNTLLAMYKTEIRDENKNL